MPAPDISMLKQPIALRTELVAQAPETLLVNQHSGGLSSADFSIVRESDHALLVSVGGKLLSWTQRRTFRDASGLPLFDLYRKATGVTWFVELPEERGSEPIMTLAPRTSVFKDKLDLFVHNAANQGEVVNLEVRGQDIWKMRVNVYLGDQVVMSSKRTEKLAGYIPGKRPDWKVNIAEGFDASLAAVIMVVLAATLYDSSMTTSFSTAVIAGGSGSATTGS
ncbi:hypothetical protein KCU81_g8774, partial [Aureobasidium melanogenum]|uniref:Tubby C-terminal-like domain-containing protein n=1 Tax=Aureobasidium melanogenum (strain CBS 110374) TaxID=1043003 RepID=A0A074VZF5_AURM1